MYRVLFAEDELLVRLGLQNSIKWEDYGMELAGEADNGSSALEMFMELRPDLLITDIKMGGMDGYELIRRVREIDADCAVIIISCLDDFETLRKMIGYCIIGYILKASMTMQEISDVLNRAREYLDHLNRQPKNTEAGAGSVNGEEWLKAYLEGQEGQGKALRWKVETGLAPEEIETLLFFRLRTADSGKINGLGMKLVRSLLLQWLPGSFPVQMQEESFCVLSPYGTGQMMEGIRKFSGAVDNFLGVGFDVTLLACDREKTIRENYCLLVQKERESGNGEQYILIENAVRYMRENYGRQLTLTGVSGYLCLSPSYFSALFKKQTGKNFVEYLNDIRLEKVLWDLRYTREKVAVIAERCGFRNTEYFNRFFKKKIGISPARWRQENNKESGEEAG